MVESKIKQFDFKLLDSIFEMEGGYVLDFSNATFQQFVFEEVQLDIYSERFSKFGNSKGKRLKALLQNSSNDVVVKLLLALWSYQERTNMLSSGKVVEEKLATEFFSLIERLGGVPPKKAGKSAEAPKISKESSTQLFNELIKISSLGAQARGYAFEKFLFEMFNANGLAAKASFKLSGEQIDGSFELNAETYLLEAKWTAQQVGVADLRAFNAKVQDKATWARGLFISDSGFTDEGLESFGRGKSVVCMDGLDLVEMFQRGIAFSEVLSKKIRRAAETGKTFVRVRELFL
jgi:hypothetical protein